MEGTPLIDPTITWGLIVQITLLVVGGVFSLGYLKATIEKKLDQLRADFTAHSRTHEDHAKVHELEKENTQRELNRIQDDLRTPQARKT